MLSRVAAVVVCVLAASARRPQPVRRVVLDTGAGTGDFPRGYELWVSRDGSQFDRVASGSGSGQLTAIDLRPTRARALRIVQTGSAPQWRSVADLRVYG